MKIKRWTVTLLSLCFAFALPAADRGLSDDFSGDLDSWTIHGDHAVSIVDSGDPGHDNVMELRADGPVWAVVKESDRWNPVRFEADFLFPK